MHRRVSFWQNGSHITAIFIFLSLEHTDVELNFHGWPNIDADQKQVPYLQIIESHWLLSMNTMYTGCLYADIMFKGYSSSREDEKDLIFSGLSYSEWMLVYAHWRTSVLSMCDIPKPGVSISSSGLLKLNFNNLDKVHWSWDDHFYRAIYWC